VSDSADLKVWERLSNQALPSWYLDPLVAKQKRDEHLELLGRWTAGAAVERAVKTDLFEDAFGSDGVFNDLFMKARLVCGMDTSFMTARMAARRTDSPRLATMTCDVRRIPVQDQSLDAVISLSTLDHFRQRHDFVEAIREISRTIRPGGLLVLTLDNAYNPTYHALRLACRTFRGPFPLGYTPTASQVAKDLREAGLSVEDEGWLIHNPRGISTLVFLGLRKLLAEAADAPIGWLLRLFARLGRLPTRRFTACFFAMLARKQ
jgi:SAM-dependent methyltransferase